MFQTKVVEEITTHILTSKTFSKNRTVYGIRGKNTVEPDRTQMTTWHMGIACWIRKATNMHSECVILTLFHCNNDCMNSLQFYVVPTLPVLFVDDFD
jgi:hypothetical protein